jgi:DNA-binding NtrC family response regulator
MVFDTVSMYSHGKFPLEPFRKRISSITIPEKEAPATNEKCDKERSVKFFDVIPPLKEIEKIAIEEALRRTEGNQTQAAHLLGVTRKALSSRLSRMRKDS